MLLNCWHDLSSFIHNFLFSCTDILLPLHPDFFLFLDSYEARRWKHEAAPTYSGVRYDSVCGFIEERTDFQHLSCQIPSFPKIQMDSNQFNELAGSLASVSSLPITLFCSIFKTKTIPFWILTDMKCSHCDTFFSHI